jgi:hypothetical protein
MSFCVRVYENNDLKPQAENIKNIQIYFKFVDS